MNSIRRRRHVPLLVAALAVAALLAFVPQPSRAAPSVSSLSSQLAAQQARQQQLSQSIGGLSGHIASLDNQIAIVRGREAEIRAQLAHDRVILHETHVALKAQRVRIRKLRAALAWARNLLAQQLVSGYEGGHPDLVSVVMEARGFAALLDQFTFLSDAENQQQRTIAFTRHAKALADAAAARLVGLQRADATLVHNSTLRVQALSAMDWLLGSKEGALAHLLASQQASLSASRAAGGQLKAEIARVHAQEAAAAAAAAAQAAAARRAAASASVAAPNGPSVTPVATGPALGPSGGWAIPYPIVLCESGGQNLSPNWAGASGYYQIMPATWKLFGGSGPAAYLAPKSEQDAVASRIWAGGSGAHNWDCAAIVGIH